VAKTNITKNNNSEIIPSDSNGDILYNEISGLIEQNRRAIFAQATGSTVFLFWEIGKRINDDILENKRAGYGKKIVSILATQLKETHGSSFAVRNLRRMMQFAEQFPNFEIVSMPSTQLSWSHFIEVLPLKSQEAKMFYLNEASRGLPSVIQLREMISRKAYERREIADTQISKASPIPLGTFKDPYLFDVLGIKDEYLEVDVEEAILRELEKFILEFGNGFTFVERQKRMILDGHDRYLDLLFYNRELRRLVAVELKIGRFRAEHKGQMQLYLAWLDKHERKDWEESPIGLILCSESGREEIELLKLDRDGILVAEYWTALPPKAVFEEKIQTILAETRERMAERNLLISGESEMTDNEIE
jgi:predicted nuclease of restriction endonuclease-like (RecB) superfamily